MSRASKHRRAGVGDRAMFDETPYLVMSIDGDSFTLIDAATHTSVVGVHRADKRLRIEPTTGDGLAVEIGNPRGS